MPPAAIPATPTERFAAIIDGLCRAVAARGGGRDRLDGPLVILIWRHLRRLAAQIIALAARIEAGRHRRYPARRPPRPGARRRVPPVLPHGFAWLVRLVPQAAAAGSQLQYLLAAPEMAPLLDAAPQMRRLLRPLCRMLGVRPPPGRSLSSGRPQADPVGVPPPAVPLPAGHTPPAAPVRVAPADTPPDRPRHPPLMPPPAARDPPGAA